MSEEQTQLSQTAKNAEPAEARAAISSEASPFSISYLLDSSWATFKNTWLALLKVQLAGLLIGILATAVAILLLVIIATTASVHGQGSHSIITPILIALGIIIFVVGAILLGSWVQLKQLYVLAAKQEPLWTFNWPAILGLVGVTLLSALAIIGGFILLIIPGILFAVWLSQAQYVYVFEGLQGKAALSRSKKYVSGRWWQVFGRLILPSLAVYALSAIATTLTSILQLAIGSVNAELIGTLIQILINVGGSLFILCYSYHLYLGLKSTVKEGHEVPAATPEV